MTTETKKSSIWRTTCYQRSKSSGLGHVGVGVQVVGAQDVLLGLRGRQDDHRDRAQIGVRLDRREHLAAVDARQVEVEQDEVGPRRVGVLALVAQERHRLHAVGHHVQGVVDLVVLERLAE